MKSKKPLINRRIVVSLPKLQSFGNRNECRIDVCFLATGVYFVKAGNKFYKFVKM